MTEPVNHTVTITLPEGKMAHATVIYLQPKAERWSEQTARVRIECGEWLEAYWHPAIYDAGDKRVHGKFIPHTYKVGESHGWVFEGSFERDE